MVSLDDLVEAEKERPVCRACSWHNSLPKDVKAALDAHIARGTATAPLHRACLKLDPPVPVGYQMFRKHVAGLCQPH